MNPLDLLHTNAFVATNEIEFNENNFTRDRINVLKTIDQPFPKRFNRNWEPIVSNEVRDIVKDRYKKYRITALTLDSRDRDFNYYPHPNNYSVVLGRQFNYIESITLLNIDLSNIFITKTQITWILSSDQIYSVDIPCGIYSAKKLEKIMIQYMSSIITNDGSIQNFYVQIDPCTNNICIINRLQNSPIIATQIITNPTDDIFTTVPPNGYQNNGIYIITKQQFTNLNMPLIPTDIPIIVNQLFNNVAFWNGLSEGNRYESAGTVTISGVTYYRYLLIPEENINFITSQNLILSAPIAKYLINNNIIDFEENFNTNSIIGEAQEFTIDFQNSDLMDIFGWNECDNDFRYILCNNSDLNISKDKCFRTYMNEFGEYIFTIEPYIFMKLSTESKEESTIAGNLVKSQELPPILKCDCLDHKGITNIFAKINLMQGNKVETTILKFYETPLENLDNLTVTFVDRNGCLIDLKCDNTVTLEIVEAIDVLKDTYIDSRHGEAIITGIRNQ